MRQTVGQIRADEGVVPRSRQSHGRGVDMGRSRADEGMVPGSRQSWSRGADMGRSQADEDRDGESWADGDCSGRGYWDTDRDWNGRRRRTETEVCKIAWELKLRALGMTRSEHGGYYSTN